MPKKRPSRGSRYYRCLKFGNARAYQFIRTIHCPYKHCLKEKCPNYIPPLPRGRPEEDNISEKTGKALAEFHAREARRLREYRQGYALETAEERRTRKKREEAVALQLKKPPSIPRVLRPGYVPSYNSKYYRCRLFRARPFICKSRPRACLNCPYYVKPRTHRRGRPKGSGIWDWTDADDIREYRRSYMREFRTRKEVIEESSSNG